MRNTHESVRTYRMPYFYTDNNLCIEPMLLIKGYISLNLAEGQWSGRQPYKYGTV